MKPDSLVRSSIDSEPRWYAAFTMCNHEKRVSARLESRGVDCFLPKYTVRSRWKDRSVVLDRPLFPGYLFVNIPLRDRLKVLEVSSVVCIVGSGIVPCEVPASEVEAIRSATLNCAAEPHVYLKTGQRVQIVAGPLFGIEGILQRFAGKLRVVIHVNSIVRAFAVEVDSSAVRVLQDESENSQSWRDLLR